MTPKVLAWLRSNGPASCLVEIKATSGRRIAQSALLDHQRRALLDAFDGGIVHKLSDESRRQQPCDAFKVSSAAGYVIACFTSSPRVCLVIDVRKWDGASRETECEWRFEI